MIDTVKRFLMYRLPFSFWQTLDELIKKNKIKTVLDLGCGDGSLMAVLNKDQKLIVDGVDLFDKYLVKAGKAHCYRKIYKSDVLKFKPKTKYDLVFWSHNIEHLKAKDAHSLLKKINEWEAKLIIIMTPYGYMKQEEYDENKYQEHLSEWYPKDFKKYGFKCKIKGLASYLIQDDGKLWKETISYRFIKFALSPLFDLSDPYLICWKIR